MSVTYPLTMQEREVIRDYVEELFSDVLLPFVKTNLSATSNQKRRSLFQELAGVIPSSRRIILSSKRQFVQSSCRLQVCSDDSEERRLMIEQACEATAARIEGPHRSNRSTKREMLDWISADWEELGQVVTPITANQRTLPSSRRELRTTMK
jgi:hypothetical protein